MAPAESMSAPLYQVKLLQALRNGDPALIHPFLAEISKDKRKSNDDLDTGAAALHLAVRCASVDTVSLLLSHRAISPNGLHPPGSATTPLHLAASLGRVDIVNLLLEQEGINDTLRDAQGRMASDVARGRDVLKSIHDSHAFLNASYRSLLRSYILSPPTEPPASALLALLASPRTRFVDLSYLDDGSGRALLHEAARRKDLRLIELAVRAGADVFVRDRRGKMAGEGGAGKDKDERVRVFLRQFANHDTTLIEPDNAAALAEPPVLKGYLNKYTNVARGYSTRWFVLKNGILSYYRRQEEETIASRGSIRMQSARLKASTTDRMRFEVHAAHTGGPQPQKWYMKANHPVEAARWTAALGRSIEWGRLRELTDGEGSTGASVSGSGSGRLSVNASVSESGREGGGGGVARRRSGESDSSGLRSVRSARSAQSHAQRLSGTLLRRSGKSVSGSGGSLSSRVGIEGDASPDLNLMGMQARGGGGSTASWNGSGSGPCGEDEEDAEGDDEAFGEGESSDAESGGGMLAPPHEDEFELHGNSVAAQMELTAQLLAKLDLPDQSALQESFGMVQGLLNEHVEMSREREAWWRRQLERERKRLKFWEESLATVVREGETLEKELRVRSRKRGSRFFDSAEGTLRQRPSHLGVPGVGKTVQEEPRVLAKEYFPEAPTEVEQLPPRETPKRTKTQETITPSPSRTPTLTTPALPVVPLSKFAAEAYDDEAIDTDEEDEFFDAIESGTLPNLIIPDSLAFPGGAAHALPRTLDLAPYAGYANLRLSLDLNEERPSTSLWSVLKHSIGKDLTKISFPVFFNEPTSMLQRMAEDMEFSECLDAAARDKDPLRRLAFVAAFAMSNYSSTIGRIAKPFNPMLSETFEYVRFDKEYRYMSEQVSHHPPISACWAESPSWHYYGEVDAQNKFMGKSFEIRPTGIAHAELIIPAERGGPEYPAAPERFGEGKVVEHYSWKKVTTNVSGFILGSPTIDHYGDMIVTNHRTGDQCILTFKPRGWRGKDAFEIAGEVVDASGRVAYQLAGRWNSQLIASPAPAAADGMGGGGALNPDLHVVDGAISPGSGPPHFVLWRNSDKPAGSPFNLTPFAITLNDCPEATLRPYLCPTDCRLRPDQRAFELGKWELANELKNEQEQKQRAVRKAREEGRKAPHRPRWFRAETDGDTGERVWSPSRVGEMLEYWMERERVYAQGGAAKAQWKDVDDIFIEAPGGIMQQQQ